MTTWYATSNSNGYKTGKKFSVDEPSQTVTSAGLAGDGAVWYIHHDGEPDKVTTWYASKNPNSFVTGKKFSVDEPCCTIGAAGLAGDSRSHWFVHHDGELDMVIIDANKPARTVLSHGRTKTYNEQLVNVEQPAVLHSGVKPPYRVASMDEINAVPWNGLNVVSTFSGAGGSCLGYRMAGYRVLWANEFVPEAKRTYRANIAVSALGERTCTLDGRDIHEVLPEEILEATGLQRGELDLFDGSPPCQAFSMAGKRQKGWGEKKEYEHGAKQQNEELFTEYIRVLRGLQPRVFIAENVTGLIRGTAKGFFLDILKELKVSGYVVEVRVLDAQWLGVPQHRERVVFQGVRADIAEAMTARPAWPEPLPYRYSVRDACPNLSVVARMDEPTSSILADGFTLGQRQGMNVKTTRPFTIDEVRALCSFPDDFILTGTRGQQWERLGNSVPPVMMSHLAAAVRDGVLLPYRQAQLGGGKGA